MTDLTLRCPSCDTTDPTCIGRLPDCEWFAGTRLAHPLPGGYLYRCRECCLKFRYPIQTPATYSALYDNAKTNTWQPNVVRPDWDLIIEQIKAYAPLDGRVLDFGCYSGGLLSKLDKHYGRFGVEVNHDAACVAEQTAHAHVWNSLHDIPSDIQFDAIVLSDVIEHVPDPGALLNILASRLANNGIVLVTTGDANARLWNFFGANWWYCFYPEHIAFVSLEWTQRTLCKRRWSILEYKRFRYGELAISRRVSNFAAVCFYGIAPKVYLRVCKYMKAGMGRGDVTSIPGRGITRDHLLLTLQREQQL